MKTCRICNVEKSLDNFYKLSKARSYGDGYDTRCKECIKKLSDTPGKKEQARIRDKNRQSSPKRLESQHRYRQSEKGKLGQSRRYKKYRKTEYGRNKGLERMKQFRQTAKFKQAIERYRSKYPEKRKAQYTLYNAVHENKIIRPNECSICRKSCIPQGHHYDYSKPLSVIWLCKKCHSDLHWASITV